MPHLPLPLPLHPRADPLTDARTTLSSWPSCMSKAYCKYPIIVSITLASLLVLSLLYCVSRCGGRSAKKKNGYEVPRDGGAYERRPPMGYAAQVPAPTGYARVDALRGSGSGNERFNEDALPAMPSWDQGVKRRVELQEDDVEPESHEVLPNPVGSNAVQSGQNVPLMGPPLVRSPYASPLQEQPANRYYNAPQQPRRPPGMVELAARTAPAPLAAAASAPISPLEVTAGGRNIYEIDTRSQPPRDMYEVDAQSMRHPGAAHDYAPGYLHRSTRPGNTGYAVGQQLQQYAQGPYVPDAPGYGANGGRYAGEGGRYVYGVNREYGDYEGQRSSSATRFAPSPQAQTPFGRPSQHQQQSESVGRQIVRKPVGVTWRDI